MLQPDSNFKPLSGLSQEAFLPGPISKGIQFKHREADLSSSALTSDKDVHRILWHIVMV